MAPETTVVGTPAAPALLPVDLQSEWRKRYSAAYQEAAGDPSVDESSRKQAAHREANRLLRTPQITSYEQAMRLPAWQFIRRDEVGGQLKVVTIDGKKYSLPAPRQAEREQPKA